ncbi:hypothetical protein AB0H71_12830 [Nocardia sp. NPDC050697]|uniref:hypothetical protein n=1 Tax=Nocardia sp. NPDC050697 TaxID=3155158 RepID=UPI0033C53618
MGMKRIRMPHGLSLRSSLQYGSPSEELPPWINDVGSTVIPGSDWTTDDPPRPFDPRRQCLMVPGGVPQCIYHCRRDCGVLDADSRLAWRCGQQAGVRVVELRPARRRAIACPMCLPGEAAALGHLNRMKRCVFTFDSEVHADARLLTWRRDRNLNWLGIVIFEQDGVMARSMATADELRPSVGE